MPTSAADFQRYLEAPEGDRFEFKSASGGFHFEELVKYCVALANEGGGKIYVLHNTMLQPPPPEGQERTLGGSPGLGHGGPMLNTASRNNILHVSGDWSDSINDRDHDPSLIDPSITL